MKRHLAWPVPVVARHCCPAAQQRCRQRHRQPTSSTATRLAAAAPNPLAEKAATEYKAYAVAQIDELVGLVKVFTDAVRAD